MWEVTLQLAKLRPVSKKTTRCAVTRTAGAKSVDLQRNFSHLSVRHYDAFAYVVTHWCLKLVLCDGLAKREARPGACP